MGQRVIWHVIARIYLVVGMAILCRGIVWLVAAGIFYAVMAIVGGGVIIAAAAFVVNSGANTKLCYRIVALAATFGGNSHAAYADFACRSVWHTIALIVYNAVITEFIVWVE